MKDKCFNLFKELCLTQAQSAGIDIQKEIDLAKELYCETADVSQEKFDFAFMDIWTVLSWEYRDGIDDWNDFINHYSFLLDDLQERVEITEREIAYW